MVYFGGFFPELEFSRGFLYIPLFCCKDQRSCDGRGGDIILHNLGAQRKDTPSYGDFLRGFFFLFFRRKDQRSCDGQEGGRRHNMINMTIRELYYTDFFQNWNFSIYIFYIILTSPKVTAKLRRGGGGGGAGKNIFFRVQPISIRVQCISVESSVAQ